MTIYDLIDHFKKCPVEFQRKEVSTRALVADTYRKVIRDYTYDNFSLPDNKTFEAFSIDYKISIQLCCWLLSYKKIKSDQNILRKLNTFLFTELANICKYVKHQKWLEDDDRSEELIRLLLKSLEIIPEGENAAEAADRFESLSTIKRLGVLEKSNNAYERMLEIRRKLAEQKAREAANPYGRE